MEYLYDDRAIQVIPNKGIPVKEGARKALEGENGATVKALRKWLEQQLQQVVAQYAQKLKNKAAGNPAWMDYQLSPEILAMAPRDRKPIYGDYKEELATILEEEYR